MGKGRMKRRKERGREDEDGKNREKARKLKKGRIEEAGTYKRREIRKNIKINDGVGIRRKTEKKS